MMDKAVCVQGEDQACGECAPCVEMDEFHERLRVYLRDLVTERRATARDLREQAHACEQRATMVEEAVRTQKWYKLEGILENAEIESLCSISPQLTLFPA